MKLTRFAGSVLLLLGFAQTPVFALQTVAADGSGNFTTIQAGLDAAAVGEEVQVIDGGTYAESLNINGEILTSVPAGATIDAGGGNGVIIWGDLDATVDGFTINNAVNGIHIDASPADVQIKNCTINATTGMNFGVGASTVTVTNCTINATGNGMLFNTGAGHTCNIVGCTITATNEQGLAVYQTATVNLADSFIINCGQCGLRTDGTGEPVIDATNTQISDNGSCIGLMRKGVYTFTGCMINGNGGVTGDANWQGGFFVDSASAGSTLNFINTSISNNFNRGLFTGRPVTLNMTGCTVSGNGGMGVIIDDYVGTTDYGNAAAIADTAFLNNGDRALVVAAKEVNATATITGCTFKGNAATALSCEADNSQSGKTITIDIERNKFMDGAANSGSLVTANVAAAGSRIVNNLFEQGATGLTLNGSAADIFNNTFAGTAAGNGINIAAPGGLTVNIENNIIAGYDTGVVSTNPDDLSQVTVDYNMVESVTADFDTNIAPLAGPNNLLGLSPEFLQASNTVGLGDYRLALSSPAVDAGIGLGVTNDLKGNPRDATPDLGAYEYESPVNIVISDWTVY